MDPQRFLQELYDPQRFLQELDDEYRVIHSEDSIEECNLGHLEKIEEIVNDVFDPGHQEEFVKEVNQFSI